jgi:isoleucyl-tRNA synthetase
MAREIVSRVQRLRRDSGLEVSDRIHLGLAAEPGCLADAVEVHGEYIAGETLATAVTTDAGRTASLEHTVRVEIGDESITLGLSRAQGSKSKG